MVKVKYIYDHEGNKVNEYTVKNGQYQFSVINLGAAITKMVVPNRDMKYESIHLRYHDYKHYKNNCEFLGSLVDLNYDISHQNFTINDYFQCEFTEYGLVLRHERNTGYIEVSYKLVDDALVIQYDNDMGLNLSNSLYFNLSGNVKSTIHNHIIEVDGKAFQIPHPEHEFTMIKGAELSKIHYLKNGICVKLSDFNGLYFSNNKQFNEAALINRGLDPSDYIALCFICNCKQTKTLTIDFDTIAK